MQRGMMQEHMYRNKDKHLEALATHGKSVMKHFRTLSLALTKIAPQPIFIPPPEIVLDRFEKRKQDRDR